MTNIIKKTISVLLLMVLITSMMPFALAKQTGRTEQRMDSETKAEMKTTFNSKSNINESEFELREKVEIKERWREKKEQLEERTEQQQERIAAAKIKVAEAREKVAELDQNFAEAKHNYAAAKETYHRQKKTVLELRQKAQKCIKNCEEKEHQLQRGIKTHLIRTNQLLEKSIEQVLNRLEHAPITAEEKEEAAKILLVLQQRLAEQQKKIEALPEAASNDELREAIADLKTMWKEVHRVQQRVITLLTQAKLSSLYEKYQEYLNGMDLRIASLENEEIDVSELRIIRNQFEKHIQQFNLHLAVAEKIWIEAKTGRDVLNELHQRQRQMKESIKETKRLLHEFLKLFSELKEEKEKAEEETSELLA